MRNRIARLSVLTYTMMCLAGAWSIMGDDSIDTGVVEVVKVEIDVNAIDVSELD